MQNSDCIDSIPLKSQDFAHKNSPNNIKCDSTLKVIHWGIRLHWFHRKSQRFILKQYTPHHNVCSSKLNMKCVKRCLRRRDTEPCSGYVTQHRDDKTSLPLLLEAWPFRHTGWQAGSVESQGGPGKWRTRRQTLPLKVPLLVTTRVSEQSEAVDF